MRFLELPRAIKCDYLFEAESNAIESLLATNTTNIDYR